MADVLSELLVPRPLWNDIRTDLLGTPELERAAIGYAGQANVGARSRMLLRDWMPVPADEYLVQLGNHLEVSPAFWARAAKRARATGEALVIMHSHPRDRRIPRFSGSDDFGEERLIPKIHARAKVPVVAAVVSPGGESVRVTLSNGTQQSVYLTSVGEKPFRVPASSKNTDQFDRQIRALGEDGHKIIAQLKVGVVGAGGLGSHVVQQLVHLGVTRIVVIDPDRVNISNLSRLVGASHMDARLRRRKTRVVRRLARQVGARTSVIEVAESVTDSAGAKPLLDCDVIVGCTDNHWSRTVLNAIAFQFYIPFLDLGVELQNRGAMGGRATWLVPGSACLWCLGILDPERVRIEQLPLATRQEEIARGYLQGVDEPAPAVVSINGVVASLGVTELLARVTGFAGDAPRPNLLLYRLNQGDVRRASPPPKGSCPTCSSSGNLGVGDLGGAPWTDPAA